jgi:hypothetical protein
MSRYVSERTQTGQAVLLLSRSTAVLSAAAAACGLTLQQNVCKGCYKCLVMFHVTASGHVVTYLEALAVS